MQGADPLINTLTWSFCGRHRAARGWFPTLLLPLVIASCTASPDVVTLSGAAQGTTWQVKFWGADGADCGDGTDADSIGERLEVELARIDRALSNYRSDSVIERFNAEWTTEPVTVVREIVDLVQIARRVSEASNGCYDLTVKPLFELWGFTGDRLTPPTPAALEDVRKRVGFHHLEALPPERLRRRIPGLQVDLSSIAQGYSVGRLAAVLEAAGVENYLVEIGGELKVRGRKPDGTTWRIGIERPVPGRRTLHKTLVIRPDEPVAVLTSGTYRHFYDARGIRYSHILDARTGQPVRHEMDLELTRFHGHVSTQSISTWVAQAAADSGKPRPNKEALSTAEREELSRLRRQVRQLQQERDILAKATAWFAGRGDKTSTGSTNS